MDPRTVQQKCNATSTDGVSSCHGAVGSLLWSKEVTSTAWWQRNGDALWELQSCPQVTKLGSIRANSDLWNQEDPCQFQLLWTWTVLTLKAVCIAAVPDPFPQLWRLSLLLSVPSPFSGNLNPLYLHHQCLFSFQSHLLNHSYSYIFRTSISFHSFTNTAQPDFYVLLLQVCLLSTLPQSLPSSEESIKCLWEHLL